MMTLNDNVDIISELLQCDPAARQHTLFSWKYIGCSSDDNNDRNSDCKSCSSNCNSSIRSCNILVLFCVLSDIVTRRQSLGSWNVVE